ncbi:MAG TPA: hypothetical protein VFF27_07365 [Bacteroidia bacterium]|jgi:hypothetical protein|nr:hypothetical protein [Bacteroidia bacterium]
MEEISDIIPKQFIGTQTGATSKIKLDTRHKALLVFKEARERLLDINNWEKICGSGSAEFTLTDGNGEPLNGTTPKIGHLIRIKLPAPANKDGDGYDWVRIEEFEESKSLVSDSELYGFRVRPVENPKNKSGNTAHFYTDHATSTFLVIRYSHTIFALERGKNEVPNNSDSWLSTIRNKLVAITAMIGLSKPQWKKLVEGILTPPK